MLRGRCFRFFRAPTLKGRLATRKDSVDKLPFVAIAYGETDSEPLQTDYLIKALGVGIQCRSSKS